MSVNYSENQREPTGVYGESEGVYFWDCDKLFFTINKDYLDHLVWYNRCDERFMGSDRLKIEIKD